MPHVVADSISAHSIFVSGISVFVSSFYSTRSINVKRARCRVRGEYCCPRGCGGEELQTLARV